MSDLVTLDPESWLCLVDGPLHGRVLAPIACDCDSCTRSSERHRTWPLRIRPALDSDAETDAEGVYLLAWVWCPDGAPEEDILEDQTGAHYLASAYEQTEGE